MVGPIKISTYERSAALIKTRFNTILSAVEEIAKQPTPLTQVQLRTLSAYQSEATKKRADFEGNLQRVLANVNPEEAPIESLSQDQDEINDSFVKIQSIVESLIPPEEPKTPSAHSEDHSMLIPTPTHIRLPKLELKHFDGNPLQWVSFINLFDSSVHRNAGVSNVAKFQYLLGVLSGEPLNLIKSLNITTANYLVAYQLLRSRYHNSRRLISLHLNQIIDLPDITSTAIRSLRTFINLFYEHSEALKALDCDVSSNSNPLLSALILRKMDNELRKKLEAYRSSHDHQAHSLPEVTDMVQFLNAECSQAEDANLHLPNTSQKANYSQSSTPKGAKNVRFASEKSTKHVAFLSTEKNLFSCFACNNQDHKIYGCSVFKDKSPQERYQLVKKEKRCVSCLGNHNIKHCKSQSTCSHCQKQHHSLLHFKSRPTPDVNPHNLSNAPSTSGTGVPAVMASQLHSQLPSNHSTVLLGTLLVQLATPEGNTHVFRALLDSGSMCDFISERAAQLLSLRRSHSTTQIVGISQTATPTKGMAHLDVKTLSGRTMASQQPFLILNKITVDLPRVQLAPEVFQKAKTFVLADPTFHLPGGVDVLLGGKLFPLLLTQKRHSIGLHMPHAIGSHFGYIITGQAPCVSPPTSPISNYSVSLLSTSEDLHSSLQRFWQQEELPSHSKVSVEEQLCDEHFISTHTREADGRYVVSLPFKHSHAPLGESRLNAERRFHALERKFKVQPHFRELYCKFMKDYLSSGHMEKIHESEVSVPHYFLPHHGVLKENSSTTQLRTVFDASAQTSTGLSLNDILLTGRKLQTDICDILLHFRTHNIVFTCDIRQMYRQIKVSSEDQLYQLILWREDTTQEISIYKLCTVTYGLNSSPYLAIRTLSQLAADEGDAYPDAAKILTTQTYVDDVISGAEDEDAALDLQGQLIALLNKGGFELRKWSSNSTRLLQAVPKDHLESPVFLQDSTQPHFCVLGIHWSPTTDVFSYQLDLPTLSCTKRNVLSDLARIYDPCGFLAPITMWCKYFMQLLWIQQVGWDEPMPTDLANKWHAFMAELPSLSPLKIPRALHCSNAHTLELHGFADASERGYAAVVYVRSSLPNNNVIVRQLIAKTRVAPLKKVTLPRLELCAAHLLAQLVTYCLTVFPKNHKFTSHHLWCDSTVTLGWLQTPPHQLKTYVGNRVAQTQEMIPPEWWHHISGSENPADCASRGIFPSQLLSHSLWWTGPKWLQLPHDKWPASKLVPQEPGPLEERKLSPVISLSITPTPEWDVLSKFSSWNKLVRVTAYILRFIHNIRTLPRAQGPLTLSEMQQATHQLVKLIQAPAFAEDITALHKKLECSTKLRRLTPFLDTDGLLRVGGRLQSATVTYDAKHPLLLPKHHYVVNLLISHYHVKHLHAGPQLTQALISQKYWILSARSVIRSNIFRCVTCFRHKPRNKTPLMGDLPSPRVVPTRPFLHTGVDYGGPFNVRVHNLRGTRTIKVYISLFVCLVTKAVHLEVVTDLTTDAFIASLTRFVSRRGLCSDIYSDCGTNFVGANTLLKNIVKESITSEASRDKINDFCLQQSIKFHFNPPASPNFGGIWESAIKSAKHHLYRVIGEHLLTLMEFTTLTTQIEAMLNSRPLTPLSSDPADYTALTPGHFLIGSPLAAVPEVDLSHIPDNRLRHWQLIQAFSQRIWRRWKSEYLHTLQQRGKWTSRTPQLQIGELVLIQDSSPPLRWPMGRISALHPGKDGIVRVVEVRTAHGTFKRPVSKVFPLPTN